MDCGLGIDRVTEKLRERERRRGNEGSSKTKFRIVILDKASERVMGREGAKELRIYDG